MLRSETLFGKRENLAASKSTLPLDSSAGGTLVTSHTPTPPAMPAAPAPTQAMPAIDLALTRAPGSQPAGSPAAAASNEGGSRLIVGPNIKLKGVEITDCDTLVVEGKVEATIDSRLMQIAACGSFKGSAEIDIAEIHGEFDGDLNVRQKLVIHASGKVTGKVRYGKLVVEEGGQLAGDIQVGAPAAARGIVMAKSGS